MQLQLNKWESEKLLKEGHVQIIRSNYDLCIEKNKMTDEYDITILNPYDSIHFYNEYYKGKYNYGK